ncbi:MAG: hypothetical protein H8E44_19635 [Planctomycetes bacterium]|nr:hypothetical protein [Planctomycetota bacterium]MBL7041987.1 hypothetical protein [Pirellulaceae bacterium]
MRCCGGKTAKPLTSRHRLQVRYLGGRTIVVKGPATGTDYRFSGRDRVQLVDPRDGASMIRVGVFRIETIVELPEASAAERRKGGREDG